MNLSAEALHNATTAMAQKQAQEKAAQAAEFERRLSNMEPMVKLLNQLLVGTSLKAQMHTDTRHLPCPAIHIKGTEAFTIVDNNIREIYRLESGEWKAGSVNRHCNLLQSDDALLGFIVDWVSYDLHHVRKQNVNSKLHPQVKSSLEKRQSKDAQAISLLNNELDSIVAELEPQFNLIAKTLEKSHLQVFLYKAPVRLNYAAYASIKLTGFKSDIIRDRIGEIRLVKEKDLRDPRDSGYGKRWMAGTHAPYRYLTDDAALAAYLIEHLAAENNTR